MVENCYSVHFLCLPCGRHHLLVKLLGNCRRMIFHRPNAVHDARLTVWMQWSWTSSKSPYNIILTSLSTLSCPVVSNGHTSECSGPYWSNPPFLIFWHSGTLECPHVKKNWKGGLDQYGPEHFGRLMFATIIKIWDWKG